MVRYFAPSSMAVGVTTREACLALPTGSCHVLTADRTFDPDGLFDPAFKPDLPVDRVRARLAGLFPHHPLPHNLDYAHAVVARALRLIHRERFDAVIAHYPNRFTLLAGLIVHVLTRLPLVLHMHDYLSEAMQPIHPLRAWWWRRVERAAFERAALVVVPTPRFAEQYRRRGYHRVFVLPHLVTPRVAAPAVRQDDAPLDIVFTGAIYEATAESARALVEAVRGRRDVRLRFATPNPHDFLGDASVGAVSRQRCLEMQEEADVVFLPLGLNSIYPLELQSCLPSKLLDYLGGGQAGARGRAARVVCGGTGGALRLRQGGDQHRPGGHQGGRGRVEIGGRAVGVRGEGLGGLSRLLAGGSRPAVPSRPAAGLRHTPSAVGRGSRKPRPSTCAVVRPSWPPAASGGG